MALGVVATLLAACAPKTEETRLPEAPEFTFSVKEAEFPVYVDSSVLFEAEQVKGTDVKTSWSVNGELVATLPSIRWKFTELGVSTVSFLAQNNLGRVTKEYKVTVLGIPLEVVYSIKGDAATAEVGVPFEASVTVVGGDKGTVHSWKLDDVVIGTDASISRTFAVADMGEHTLSYEGVNTDGEMASKTWTLTVVDLPLEVTFTPEETTLAAQELDRVTFAAEILHGVTGATYSWKVNGTEVATTDSYEFVCTTVGDFAVSVTVTNGIGETKSCSWTLTVTGKPLEVNFTPNSPYATAMEGEQITFAAEIVYGGSGAAYSWKLNGTEVSTSASYVHTCAGPGTYTVSVTVTNDKAENATHTWTLTVTEQSSEKKLMVIDAEGMTALPETTILKGNDNALSIVDNPCPSPVNAGSKVLKDDLSKATWATSGLVQVYLSHIASSERYNYHKVRIKVYLGINDYLPFMVLTNNNKASRPTKVNGTDFYPNHSKELWASLVKKNDWNVLEYDILTGNYSNVAASMADVTQIQFRFLVNYDNTNYPGSLSDTNTHIVYFDDIELVE